MGCLLFNSTAAFTWDKANTYCQTIENTTLIEIANEDQWAFLLMQIKFQADHEGSKDWWTSGTDAGKNGNWIWASTLTPVGNYMWHA